MLAFAGAMGAVLVTWVIGGRGLRSSTATLILAGVAVAALLTSVQTFLSTAVVAGLHRAGLHLVARFTRERQLEFGHVGASLRGGVRRHLRRRRKGARRDERR